jgi:hypothetical protein
MAEQESKASSEVMATADQLNDEGVPVGFHVRIRNVAYPYGEGPVHNDADPCGLAPDTAFTATDLATVPSEGKTLCDYCGWPDRADEALEEGN